MNGSKKVACRETLIVPDWDLETTTVAQLIERHTSECELLIPRRILTVVYDGRLVMIFAPSIYR